MNSKELKEAIMEYGRFVTDSKYHQMKKPKALSDLDRENMVRKSYDRSLETRDKIFKAIDDNYSSKT